MVVLNFFSPFVVNETIWLCYASASTIVVGGPPAIERVWISYISESPILDMDCDWNNEWTIISSLTEGK